MRANHPSIIVLFVPPNCTGKLQPQDVAVQKPLKTGFRTAFVEYQIQQFEKAMASPGALFQVVSCESN
jgi:hypothetical protein